MSAHASAVERWWQGGWDHYTCATCGGHLAQLPHGDPFPMTGCWGCARAGAAALSYFLLFVWLEARQQQFPGKGRVRRARALAELVRSGRLTVGVS